MFRVAQLKEGVVPTSFRGSRLISKARREVHAPTNCRKRPPLPVGGRGCVRSTHEGCICSIRQENLRPGSFVPAGLCRDLLRLQFCVMKEGPRCWCGGQVLAFKSGGCGCRGVVDAAHSVLGTRRARCSFRGCGLRRAPAGATAGLVAPPETPKPRAASFSGCLPVCGGSSWYTAVALQLSGER